jgi:amino acid transporter
VDLQSAPAETFDTVLHSGRLTVLGNVFFVVAAAAPLVGVTGAVPLAVVLGNGAGAPGTYLAWWAWALLARLLVLALSALGVETGARVLGPLMLLEIGSLALTTFVVISAPGSRADPRLPFAVFFVGTVAAITRRNDENVSAVANLVS